MSKLESLGTIFQPRPTKVNFCMHFFSDNGESCNNQNIQIFTVGSVRKTRIKGKVYQCAFAQAALIRMTIRDIMSKKGILRMKWHSATADEEE